MPQNTVLGDDLLSSEQAAEIMKRAPQTLANMRSKGHGPSYLKVGHWRQAPVLYRRSEIERWLNNQVREVRSG